MDGGVMPENKVDESHKHCIDCGKFGKLNDDITYRGSEYICWECHKTWIDSREQSSFKLWQEFLKSSNGPYEDNGWKFSCFFCNEFAPNHDSNCVWIRAEELIKNAK